MEALAFISGFVLGGILLFFYTKGVVTAEFMERMTNENRRMQILLDEQYNYGIKVGRKEALKEINDINEKGN